MVRYERIKNPTDLQCVDRVDGVRVDNIFYSPSKRQFYIEKNDELFEPDRDRWWNLIMIPWRRGYDDILTLKPLYWKTVRRVYKSKRTGKIRRDVYRYVHIPGPPERSSICVSDENIERMLGNPEDDHTEVDEIDPEEAALIRWEIYLEDEPWELYLQGNTGEIDPEDEPWDEYRSYHLRSKTLKAASRTVTGA
jgi:hypothetical protein